MKVNSYRMKFNFKPEEIKYGPNKTEFAPNGIQFTPNETEFAPNGIQFTPNETEFAQNEIQLTSNETQYAPTEIQISRFFYIYINLWLANLPRRAPKDYLCLPPLPYYLRIVGIALFHKECYCVGKDPGWTKLVSNLSTYCRYAQNIFVFLMIPS